MKLKHLWLSLLLVIAAAVTADAPVPDEKLVAALDKCVQVRLADTDMKRFGMTRFGQRHQPEFHPESEDEKAMVADMTKAGWDVSLYLGGRGLILPKREPYKDVSWGVAITGNPYRKDRPRPADLRDEAKKAFESFSKRASYEFRVGDWYVAARPVRASKQECVDCHNKSSRAFGLGDMKVSKGDLLGVAMYAFARSVSSEKSTGGSQ